jgi:2-deoxy-D-gluconate 3-dehydrogenase
MVTDAKPVSNPVSFSLAGRCALVTGASRGLGQAIAIAFADAGADVVCTGTTADRCAETARRVRERGRRAWTFGADLADRGAVGRLASEVDGQAGPIDILVNNAGTIRRHPAAVFPVEDWDAVLDTNLDAVFLLCRHFGPAMIEGGGGKIINVASLLSFSGGSTVSAYAASKHAVAGLTKALANEWARHNVQVNAIAPGYFRTDNTQALQDDPQREKAISERIPAGRWGEPTELGGAAVFLASRASDYVNGHILVVDGGWMAR